VREQVPVSSARSILAEAAYDHRIHELPILILFPHNRCNCRCLMCDIWKIRQVREITAEDLRPHMDSLRALKVRWVVFSGGEPLMHSDLISLARMCRGEGIRLTLLTAGLLLDRNAENVAGWIDDVIVSIDGPPEVHDAIRAVPGAFARLARGIHALRKLRPQMPVHGRCTVQKSNFRHLRNTVWAAHELGLNSISFLAADVSSEAFNRPLGWELERQNGIAPGDSEVEELDLEIKALILECQREIERGFISESPDKLRRMAWHFHAHLGHAQPASPRCNAPWVSAVVEADGTVRPCFFHRPIGNIHEGRLADVLNSEAALEFRQQLNVAHNPVCQSCVCSLYLGEEGSG
jgi:Fe-coproporphyrin III synthase